jgi:ADP-heptose:LPS heptosyltransferase
MNRVLVIQTAFIGDVILATPVIEAIHNTYPSARIDFLLRKGNEGLLENHPHLSHVYIWDKKAGKYSQLLKIIRQLRKEKYDIAINLQRFMSTGLFTVFSGAVLKIGFSKNPLSCFFTKSYPHIIDIQKGKTHEIDRNLSLLDTLIVNKIRVMPRLYPSKAQFEKVACNTPYITISPTSVWYTKQYLLDKWVEVINSIGSDKKIFLLGGKADKASCEIIRNKSTHTNIEVLAGQLSFLESAALMKGAMMNYVNDSAPMHIASAMDAPVTAVFCSTIPAFGFGPLSTQSRVVETEEKLDCRPCGLHGFRKCPEGHFKCSNIDPLKVISKSTQTI